MQKYLITEKTTNQLKVLSLFSGCGGIDLGFEGDFNVLTVSVNPEINTKWNIDKVDKKWSHLGKTVFHTVFANDIKPEAKAVWTNYFSFKLSL